MYIFFIFIYTSTTHIYTLSLHDALPISSKPTCIPCIHGNPKKSKPNSTIKKTLANVFFFKKKNNINFYNPHTTHTHTRSEEHTSELQSHSDIVCRLLLEKKKK